MSEYNLKMALDGDKTKILIRILRDIQGIGITKIALKVLKDKISISSVNDGESIHNFVTLKDTFLEKSLIENEFTFGVFDLAEFTALLNIFTDGFGLSLNEEIAVLKKSENVLRYYGCNHKLIKQPKIGEEIESLIDFNLNTEEMKPFIKALPILPNGFVIISGEAESDELKLVITDKDVKTTAFETIIKVETLNTNLKKVLDKNELISVLKGDIEEFSVRISKKVMRFKAENEFYSKETYINFKI